VDKAVSSGGIYKDIMLARTGDRYDNMETMFFLFPHDQLRFIDKTIMHLEGSKELILMHSVPKNDSFYIATVGLIDVSVSNAMNFMVLHQLAGPKEGYKLEYNMSHFADQFRMRSDKLLEINSFFTQNK
jgi:hypothetical protein